MWTRIHKALRVVTPTHVEEDQTRTWRPVKVEEHDIDFRVPGLSHVRVQELVKRIENHPHQEALHADLQQKKRVRPMQQKVEGDDPRVGQCGVIRPPPSGSSEKKRVQPMQQKVEGDDPPPDDLQPTVGDLQSAPSLAHHGTTY